MVTCPLKTLIFQRKVDIGHARHGILVKSLRARNVNSFNYVRGCDYVMWIRGHMYTMWIYGSLFMYGTCHFMLMWVCTPIRVRASDFKEERHVTFNTFSCT